LQRVDVGAHQRRERDAASQLVADRVRDLEQPCAEDRIAQVLDGFGTPGYAVRLCGGGLPEPGELRKHVPDPVRALAARADFRERRGVAGERRVLRVEEGIEPAAHAANRRTAASIRSTSARVLR